MPPAIAARLRSKARRANMLRDFGPRHVHSRWQQGEDINGRRGYGVGLGGLFGDGPVARLSDEQWRGTDLLYLGLCKRLSGVARPLRCQTTRYTRTKPLTALW